MVRCIILSTYGHDLRSYICTSCGLFFDLADFISFNSVLLSSHSPFLFTELVSRSLCPSLSGLLSPPFSLAACLRHYANTFKGRLPLRRVILQWSCTPLMCLRGLRFLPNRSISWMTPAPRLNQGHAQAAHTHTYIYMQEHTHTKRICTHI